MATCEYCDNSLPSNGNQCPFCGAPIVVPVDRNPAEHSREKTDDGIQPLKLGKAKIEENKTGKRRIVYILLALFFGVWGIHNFYARRYFCAGIQLFLMVASVSSGSAIFMISVIWIFIEIFLVKKDGRGIPMC